MHQTNGISGVTVAVEYQESFWSSQVLIWEERQDSLQEQSGDPSRLMSDRDWGIQLGAAKQSLVLEKMENWTVSHWLGRGGANIWSHFSDTIFTVQVLGWRWYQEPCKALALITARVHGQLQEGNFKTYSKNRIIGLVPCGIRMSENCKVLCLLICESQWYFAFSQLLLGVVCFTTYCPLLHTDRLVY